MQSCMEETRVQLNLGPDVAEKKKIRNKKKIKERKK